MTATIDDFLSAAVAALADSGDPDSIAMAATLGTLRAGSTGPWPDAARMPLHDHLSAAVSAPGRLPLVDRMPSAPDALPWTFGTLDLPAYLADCFMFNILIGARGVAPHASMMGGLYLQSPNTVYPDHWHEALETYFVLSGTAEWRQGDGVFTRKPPGTIIHHSRNEPHAMRTGPEPLLAFWLWRGDLDIDTYRIVDPEPIRS